MTRKRVLLVDTLMEQKEVNLEQEIEVSRDRVHRQSQERKPISLISSQGAEVNKQRVHKEEVELLRD